ncbi:MAG TPA: alpha/beta hydrolase [Burkholderiales bacterium]|nr:alpha/beta hydrolase [Burkholderiales bacterium]
MAVQLTRALIDGPAGRIETDIHDPGADRRGIAVIAHPHPPQGGTKDHKVVTTLARTFVDLGCVALRPNFRGVGDTEGSYDAGIGETEDLLAVVAYARARYGELPLTLAGFSFGGAVQTRVAKRTAASHIVLIAPAVTRFPVEPVPADTLLIHGELDEIVPLQAVLDWARPQHLPVVVVPGAEHFFHGRLAQLRELVTRYCRA